jgi:hypothetical protein
MALKVLAAAESICKTPHERLRHLQFALKLPEVPWSENTMRLRLEYIGTVLDKMIALFAESTNKMPIDAFHKTPDMPDLGTQQLMRMLPYQGEHSWGLPAKIAALYAQICPALAAKVAPSTKVGIDSSKPIRVGFLSAFLNTHSVGKVTTLIQVFGAALTLVIVGFRAAHTPARATLRDRGIYSGRWARR